MIRATTPSTGDNSVNSGQLRAFVERIENLENEIGALNEGKSQVYSEAKSSGFDARIMKKVVALRRMDRDKRIEEETILDMYLQAVGERE